LRFPATTGFIQNREFTVMFSYGFLDLFLTQLPSAMPYQNNIFKNVDMYSRAVNMSSTVARARVRRLVNLGLVDSNCTPNERILQLKSKINEEDSTFRELETFYSALGDSTRLKMLRVIGDEELCSCEVMAALELTQPTTSHHLGILERAGLLSSRRNGKWVFYKLANLKVKNLVTEGFDLVERWR
jgi:ArsR family transcriptional regulator